ncbi:MAG: TIGR02680 family protein [Tepidibacillus sp.]
MKGNKWQLHRAGLLNFWYYDEEEFQFSGGRLLLRGSNGSGKSVTMQSLLPVLLDGKKSPDRLDPFGSKARKMEDYLLGEKGIVDRDERTGYLYLEYKRQDTEQYLTTGIGLRAKRQSNMEFWGFVIYDNRRIGQDILLYKLEAGEKIPLTRRELENRLENGGKVVRTQREYMELVNKYIFGFETLDAYDELIKLLIQLRSPKLSKEFKPTVIYDILNESLPALSDEELRPLSDTIENMDQTKQQLDQLIRDQRSLKRLCKEYDQYNQFVLVEKANGVLVAHREQENVRKKKAELQRSMSELKAELDLQSRNLEQLEREEEVLKDEEKQLRDHDVFKAEEKKQELLIAEKQIEFKRKQKEQTLEEKKRKERELKDKIRIEAEKEEKADRLIQESLEELEFLAEEAAFFNHQIAAPEFKRNYQGVYQFDLWKKEVHDYQGKLDEILKILREHSIIKKRYQELEKELGEVNKDLDDQRSNERKWEQYFEEERERYLEAFHIWQQQNKQLDLSDKDVQMVASRIGQIYDEYPLEEIKAPIEKRYREVYQVLQKESIQLQQRIETKQKEIEQKKIELKEWKEKKDPEPERHYETVEARQQLMKQNIPHLPFYSAVEFHDEVSIMQRERIEAAITEMGLLDALIIPESYSVELVHDRIIRPNPQFFGYTLADLLYPTPVEGVEVTGKDIDHVLRSIVIDEKADSLISINEEGRYQIGLIEGHAPNQSQAIYIGKEARKQYRLQVIQRIEEEISALEDEKIRMIQESQRWEMKLATLEREFLDFPEDKDVKHVYEELVETRQKIKLLAEEAKRKNDRVKQELEQLQRIKNQLRELTEEISLPIQEEAYETARTSILNYQQELRDLESNYKDYQHSKQSILLYQQNLEEIQFDIDELKGELNQIEGEIKKYHLQLQQIEERLAELGAEEIRQLIENIVQRLKQIPIQIKELIANIQDIRNQINHTEAEINKKESEVLFAEQLFQKWLTIFTEDDRLQLVNVIEDSSIRLEEEHIVSRAKQVLNQYGTLLQNLDREKVNQRLTNVYYQEQSVLVEYRLTQDTIFEINEEISIDDENIIMKWDQLKQKARRIQLLMEYNGNRVSPYYVLTQIDKDIELQKVILSEKDRELYEEIILNSVGRIIRARINRAEQWVEKINRLMSERDTSSGLTFSIRWKPKTADIEEELDTKDLVDLLRLDSRLLKAEDMNRITTHFQSKITRAKEVLEEKGYGETLHQMIKEMLDYRKWFSFTLYYKREGEPKRELTNNVFYTFSGGEKAMAMYIPLFSAAYSRYLEARDDAPYIISLDEAFAGVDENNIRDMFDLVEKLGFNYIFNSQALWGDYDTVSQLSICELVRPKNASYVTVVRYHWDGRRLQLLKSEGIEENRLDQEKIKYMV